MLSSSTARLQVLAAALCFSTTGTAQALGPGGLSPVVVGAGRVLVGAVGLVAVLLLPVAGPAGVSRLRALLRTPGCWLAGLAVAGYQTTFFLAVRSTGVAVGTVVALGSAPVLTGLLAAVAGQGRPGRRWVAATALAAAGLAVLVLGRSAGSRVTVSGLALAVGAAASYALYTVPSKRMLDDGTPPTVVMAAVFSAGAVLLAPVLVLVPAAGLLTGRGVAMTLWLGLVPTTLAYLLFAAGLRVLPAAQVSTLTLAEPVAAALLGVLLLHERMSAVSAAGAGLLLAGIALLAVQPRRSPPAVVASASGAAVP